MSYRRAYFAFIAQSLDNSQPDTISVNGRILSTADQRSAERIRFVDQVTWISSRGRESRSEAGDTRAYVAGSDVVFKVMLAELDASGRLAPLLCLGSLDDTQKIEWADALMRELEQFLTEAGRTIADHQLLDLRSMAEKLAHPSAITRLFGLVRPQVLPGKTSYVNAPTELVARYARLPEAPENRRLIIGISLSQYRTLQLKPDSRALFTEPGIALLVTPLSAEARQQDPVALAIDSSLLQPNKILVQNPYNLTEYFELDEAPEALARAKLQCFAQVCQLLGAVRMEAISIRQAEDSFLRSVSAETTARVAGITVSGEYGRRELRDTASGVDLRIIQEFEGRHPNVLAAEQYLSRPELGAEKDLHHLVASLSQDGNPLGRYHVKVDTRAVSYNVATMLGRLTPHLPSLGIVVQGESIWNRFRSFEATVDFLADRRGRQPT